MSDKSAGESAKYILAIDLGTSGPKVALVSTDGDVAACEIEPTDLLLSPDGGAEQDPDDWWRAIVAASRRVLAASPVPASDVIAVSCTTQWSGTVPVDRDGRHLMNGITWLDSRGAKPLEPIVGGPLKVEGYHLPKLLTWLRKTGGAPSLSGKDPVGHIAYIRAQHPDVYQRTYKFLEPRDYLNLRLTGKFASSTECIVLHWVTDNRDIDNIRYDEQLLALARMEREKLPDLMRPDAVLGPLQASAAAELGLSEEVQVVMGSPDVMSATIGSGAVRDYEAHLYIGTSAWIICHVPFKKTDIFRSVASLPAAVPGRYYVANEQETAGACLNFLRDKILYPDDALQSGPPPEDFWERLNAAAASIPPGSDKVLFTPWLYGERTPVDDHTVRSGFLNISLATTRAHLIRAVLEGVAYNTRWLLEAVEGFVKRPLDPITMIGGGANSAVWCQIFADVLNRTIRKVHDPVQANARGAAFLAAVALGHLTFEQIPERVKVERTFTPNGANRALYDELYREFLIIYKNNKKMYARLNRGAH